MREVMLHRPAEVDLLRAQQAPDIAEPKYTTETNKRILALLDRPPPEGYARWTGPLPAAALGDVDVQSPRSPVWSRPASRFRM
jgi:hypothetical protein